MEDERQDSVLVFDLQQVRAQKPVKSGHTLGEQAIVLLELRYWERLQCLLKCALFFEPTLEGCRKLMNDGRVDDVLGNLDADLDLILVCQLVQLGKAFVANHLILVMAEAEEDDCLPLLKSWIINLHLQQDTAELDWK